MAERMPHRSVLIRPYDPTTDYKRVYRFLVETYEAGNTLANWLAPRWEYMHFHPFIVGLPLETIGVAEAGGQIVGVVHFEDSPAFVYFQIRPGWAAIGPELIGWAEERLGGWSHTLERNVIGLYIDETKPDLAALAADRGYEIHPEFAGPHARLDLDRHIPEKALPSGFRLQSLADDNDLDKIGRVLWRGFNHKGPRPIHDTEGRRMMQRAPHFRRDLTLVVVAPNGEFVSCGGMWVIPENRVAYVEPVATDPDYRRMGLGRAVVEEGLRRAAAEGATTAWVGSGQEFYLAMGFTVAFQTDLWVRSLD
jgi:predicted N-acetyltransferase YhbS